jgi:hypothetical protein
MMLVMRRYRVVGMAASEEAWKRGRLKVKHLSFAQGRVQYEGPR